MSYQQLISPAFYGAAPIRRGLPSVSFGTAKCEPADIRVILILCVLFVLMSLPETYNLVNSVWVKIPGISSLGSITDAATGKPTKLGVAVHTAVFGLILYVWVLCK